MNKKTPIQSEALPIRHPSEIPTMRSQVTRDDLEWMSETLYAEKHRLFDCGDHDGGRRMQRMIQWIHSAWIGSGPEGNGTMSGRRSALEERIYRHAVTLCGSIRRSHY